MSIFTTTMNGPSSVRIRPVARSSSSSCAPRCPSRCRRRGRCRPGSLAGGGGGLAAGGLVDLVVPDHQRVVLRRCRAIVQSEPRFMSSEPSPSRQITRTSGRRDGDAEADRGALAHGAEGVAVERAVGDLLEVESWPGRGSRRRPRWSAGGRGAWWRRRRVAGHPDLPPVSSDGSTMATGMRARVAELHQPVGLVLQLRDRRRHDVADVERVRIGSIARPIGTWAGLNSPRSPRWLITSTTGSCSPC